MSTLAPPRYTIQQFGDEIQVTIPSKKVPFQLLGLGVSLIFGFCFTGQIIYALLASILVFPDNEGRVIIFKIIMFIATLMLLGADGIAVYSLLWTIFGKEVIKANSLIISSSLQIFGWKKLITFSSKDVSNIHTNILQEKVVSPGSLQYVLGKYGVIAFNHRAKTVCFGADIDKSEADQIVSVLQQHFTQLKTG